LMHLRFIVGYCLVHREYLHGDSQKKDLAAYTVPAVHAAAFTFVHYSGLS